MKKLLSLICAFVLVLCRAGCGESAPTSPAASSFETPASTSAAVAEPAESPEKAESGIDWAKGNPVPAGDKGYCVTVNNIKLEPMTISVNDDKYCGEYYRISGLKDKEIQAQINAQIKELFDRMMEIDRIPPYRGVKLKLANFEGMDPESLWVGMYCNNVGNILSINCTASKSYNNYVEGSDNYDYDYLYIGECETLNIDLNTGKPVKFTDLFADDIDATEYCNNYINNYINDYDCMADRSSYYYDGTVSLCSEFAGLSEDHKYYLNEYDGKLYFVFDYNNPEFVTECSYCTISVPFGNHSALNQRFNGAGIYESEEPNYMLLENSFDPKDAIYVSDYAQDENNPNHSCSTYIISYSSMPKGQRDFIQPMFNTSAEAFDFLNEREAEAHELYSFTNTNAYASSDAYVQRYGDYTSVSVYHSAYVHDTDYWTTLYSYSDNYTYCFKGNSTKPMALRDLFKAGTDYKELLTDAMVSYSERVYPYAIEYDGEEHARKFFEELVDSINSFAICGDCLVLYYDVTLSDIAVNYYPDNDKLYEPCSCCNNLYYSDLGFENLTLFE